MKTTVYKIWLSLITILIVLPCILSAKDTPPAKEDKPLASNYKIVFFNDIEEYNPSVQFPYGTFLATYALYYYYLKNSKDLGQYCMESSYSTFFQNYSLNDFDIAIFPMGDQPLTYSAGGHRVIDDIESMLNNGKRVMIIGRRIMTNQFGGGDSDPIVGDFLSRELGLEFTGRPSMIAGGGSYKNFVVYGRQNDSVSDGQVKFYNITFVDHGKQYKPLRYNSDLEVMKIKNGSRSVPVDSYTRDSRMDDGYFDGSADLTYYYTMPDNTDSLVGIRCSPSIGGKVVFWCVAADNATDYFAIQYWQEEIVIAARWLSWETGGLPWPEAYILFDQNGLDFGSEPLYQTKIMNLIVTNYGRQPLHVTDIFTEDIEGGAFKLLTPGAFTLAPNQKKTIQISFKPSENRKYNDAIDFTSDASNGNLIALPLTGFGGDTIYQYKLDVDTLIDFGQVRVGQSKILPFVMKNIGTVELLYQTNQMISNGNGAFFFNKTTDSKSPILIEPDSTYIINIRFVPLLTGQPYEGFIRLDTKDTRGYIDLHFKGQGAPPSPQIYSRDSLINFGDVQNTLSKTLDFTIKNIGNLLLTVDSIYVVQDTNNAFSLVNPPALPLNFEVNTGIEQGIHAKFAPMRKDTFTYHGAVQFHSNDPNNPYFLMNLIGRGVAFVGVNESTVADANGILSIKASPNPFGESTLIQYTLNGNTSRNIEIYAVDLLGNKVAALINDMHSPGEYRLNFNAGKLSSGTYFIVAKSNDAIVRLPVAIIK